MPESQPPLPTNRAVVVQFRAPPTGAASAYDGRVEHLVSGQAARFHALEELLAHERGTTMRPVSLPDLLAGAASLGIILFLWLQ
jgi:hypothetical protein